MNRHHPYGSPYENGRRGGGPSFGPDRSHRSDRGGPPRGRGFGRGRGGGHGGGRGGGHGGPPPTPFPGGYDGSVGPYDQGPPQGDMGGYSSFEAGPPQGQDPYYQSGGFNAPQQGQFSSPDTNSRFNQDFGGEFEVDGPPPFSQGGGYGVGRPKRFPRRERDDKEHDSIIEERIQRERPCRTLFIRNIKYETGSDDVRRLFEEHGEIKTFFDLIHSRGMVFVTYYDLRAAERARERLQGSEISGRPIDVHYSLPRDDHGGRTGGVKSEEDQQFQGTLMVTLRNSISGQPIDDGEVRRKFQQFGDVKSVRPVGDRMDQRYVEFYDTRACEEAHDRLRHQGLQDGVMEIAFAAPGDDPRSASPRPHERGYERWEEPPPRGRRGGRGGRGRGRGGHGGDDWDRRGDHRDRSRPFEDEFGRDAGRGRGFNDRFDGRNGYGGPRPGHPGPSGQPGPPGPPAYGGPQLPIPPSYAQPPPTAAPPIDERLEQAKKVQQLLAALKQPGGGAAGSPSTSGPPPGLPPMPPHSQHASYYPPHSGSMPGMPPQHPSYPSSAPPPQSNTPYQMPPQQSSTPQPGPAPSNPLANLPPNILALLQQPAQAPPPAQSAPMQPAYVMPPGPPPSAGAGGPPGGAQSYQQLMAYLQSQKR